MSNEVKEYRSIFLDRHASQSNFQSTTVDVTVAGETRPVEVRELSIANFESAYVPESVVERLGGGQEARQRARMLVLLMHAAYIPNTDHRIWSPPRPDQDNSDIDQLLSGPMDQRGPIPHLIDAFNYVHGDRLTPPSGVMDPRLEEIASVAAQMEEAGQRYDELDGQKVRALAAQIRRYAQDIDRREAEGKTTTH